jgi:hypothetical protein
VQVCHVRNPQRERMQRAGRNQPDNGADDDRMHRDVGAAAAIGAATPTAMLAPAIVFSRVASNWTRALWTTCMPSPIGLATPL